jgi:transposase
VSFSLSPGHAGDAPEGRALLRQTPLAAQYVIMDRAYEGDETRQLVRDLGMTPVVPPKTKEERASWEVGCWLAEILLGKCWFLGIDRSRSQAYTVPTNFFLRKLYHLKPIVNA